MLAFVAASANYCYTEKVANQSGNVCEKNASGAHKPISQCISSGHVSAKSTNSDEDSSSLCACQVISAIVMQVLRIGS